MSTELQHGRCKQRVKLIMMLAALLAACALLTQCTVVGKQMNSNVSDEPMLGGISATPAHEAVETQMPKLTPKITTTPCPKSETTPTTTPKPTGVLMENGRYIDAEGNIPNNVDMIFPPRSWNVKSYCITRNEKGKLVCQMWEKLSLQKEWLIPESILEYDELKVIYPYCYTDKRDGKEVFTCFFKINDIRELAGFWREFGGIYYMQKNGKEFMIEYNTFAMDQWDFLFTTAEGEVYRVNVDEDMPFMVFRWQFEEGCYVVADSYFDTVYDKNHMEIGDASIDEYDEENGIISFVEPFDKPIIPEWDDVED